MMSTCSSTTQLNPEVELDIIPDTQQEAAISESSVEVSPATDQQLAILRSMSDSCATILNQAGLATAQHMSKNKPAPAEALMAKTSVLMKSRSPLPTLKTHESSNLLSRNDSSTPATRQSQQHATNPTTQRQPESSSLMFSSCLAPKTATPTKTTSLHLNLPKSEENSSESSTTLFQTKVTVVAYSKSTIQTQSSREHTTPKYSSKTPSTLQKSPSSSISPLALFSNLQKETTTTRPETKLQEKEEGKGEQGHQEHQEHQEKQQHKQNKDITIDEANSYSSISYTYSTHIPDDIVAFALSESQLSSLMHMRVSNLDILRICAEIMKLMLNSREQDSLSRLEVRKHLIEKAKDLVESYENQAKLTQWLGVATATLGIIGAASPLLGEIAGDRILEFLQKNIGIFKNASSKTFFKSMGKICSSLSQLTEASSKIYELKETASRTFSENYKEIFRIEHDEITRSIEEVKDHWKNMDNFLLQMLQTEHDAIRSLYQ
ncbi:hypothetical protein [Chlamydia avium]